MKGDLRPRVALVVQIELYRDALAQALPACGLDVVACASPGSEAVAIACSADPDVILVDVTKNAGLATLRLLAEALPEIRLVAIAVRDLDSDVLACIEAGAVGYVLRERRSTSWPMPCAEQSVTSPSRPRTSSPPSCAAWPISRRTGIQRVSET